MNNKIRVDNFFKAGGVVEFQLLSGIRVFGEYPLFMFAGSPEDVQDVKVKLLEISTYINELYNINMPYTALVWRINYSCDGIVYEPDFDPGSWTYVLTNLSPNRPKYLIAIDKCYPKKF